MNDPRRRYGTQLPDWAMYHTGQIAGVKSPRVFRWVPLSKRCDSGLSDLSCSQSPSGELEKKIQTYVNLSLKNPDLRGVIRPAN